MRLTNRLRHHLVRAARREWSGDPQQLARVLAALEHVRRSGGVISLDIPDYSGDAPDTDPNAVVVQAIDFFFGIDFAEGGLS